MNESRTLLIETSVGSERKLVL